jgi:diaminohydroxyphosphoribosylaminopyrimidine deaminase / 5-amino-6-(5-phosphoribosylamino)uracil reductase
LISHKKYMDMTLKLAAKGKGLTSPNPLVGCIIVKRGRIVGKGYHKKAGSEHAEILAIQDAGKKSMNSTMYINLEPCSHWGKTPPCTEKIVEAGVREVIIGMKDPNPLVDGFIELKYRGLKTKIGILESEARKLNAPYIKYIKSKRPYITLKIAMSVDGKIAAKDTKNITSKDSRILVHQLRSEVDAVLVGINTVFKDNPELTSRLVKGNDPMKVVLDTKCRIPINCKLMKHPEKLIVATTAKAPKKNIDRLENLGVKVIVTKTVKGHVEMAEVLKQLGKREMMHILIEGGAQINSTVIRDKLADKLMIFTSPKPIGKKGLNAIDKLDIHKIGQTLRLKSKSEKKIGKDTLSEAIL